MSKFSFLKEIWQYFKQSKKWWIAILIVFLLLISFALMVTSTSIFAPLIYPLF
ncbi:MAG: DUF5989 family protein [Patescibacteria group bacterium]